MIAPKLELLPRWKRALILLAGPVTNIVAAVFFVAVAFMVGVEAPVYLEGRPEVGWVEPESPADEAGLPGRRSGVGRSTAAGSTSGGISTSRSSPPAAGDLDLDFERDGEVRQSRSPPRSSPATASATPASCPGSTPWSSSSVPGSSPADARRPRSRRPHRRRSTDEAVDQFYDLIRLISPLPGDEVVHEVDARRQAHESSS